MGSVQLYILLQFSLYVNVIAQKYKACYEDSLRKPLFNGLGQNGPHMDGQLTISSCIGFCSANDFSYMAAQEGLLCFCSNILPAKSPKDDRFCDVACSENSFETCGGIGYISAYSTSSPAEQDGPTVYDSHDQQSNNPNALSLDREISAFSVGMYCIIGSIIAAIVVLFVYIVKTLLKDSIKKEEEQTSVNTQLISPWSLKALFLCNKRLRSRPAAVLKIFQKPTCQKIKDCPNRALSQYFMEEQAASDTAFIATRYSEYKQNYFKLGVEDVRQPILPAEWSEMSYDERAIAVLTDLFTIYQRGQNAALSSIFVKACATSIGTESFANDIGDLLPWLINWFVELDGNNETESLEPLIKCFIYLPTRTTLLNGLISYDEATSTMIIDTLLQAANSGSSQLNHHISESIYAIVKQLPRRALAVRFKLVQAQVLPGLALRLTISYIHDDVNFLNGEFTGLPSWILSQSSKIAVPITTMKHNLCDEALKEVSKEDPDQLKLGQLLRAIIGMLGFFGIKATEEEFQVCLQVIRNAQTARSIELSLSFILICAEQVLRLPLRERNALMKYVCETDRTEMPALVAIAFASNQILQVETLVREKLNMNLMMPKLGLFEMQNLFKTLESDIYAKFSA